MVPQLRALGAWRTIASNALAAHCRIASKAQALSRSLTSIRRLRRISADALIFEKLLGGN